VCSERGLKFKQSFSNNMTQKTEPSISPCGEKKEDFTRITFKPDLARFGMDILDRDTVALLTRRVYDIAGTDCDVLRVCLNSNLGTVEKVKVTFNGERLSIKSFKDYVDFVMKDRYVYDSMSFVLTCPSNETMSPVWHEKVNARWEVCASISDGGFQQMSFVNSIATTKGGTHINYVADQIVTKVLEVVNKKNKAIPVKPFQVKNHLRLFVNCLIENPTFDSQTKENMTLHQKKFGSECPLSAKFLADICKSQIVDNILNWAKHKSETQLSKATGGAKKGRLTGIPKLDDANEAGGRGSERCTLILTEGDSAKTLAVSGLSVVGRDNFGVFPLRGKLLNVREANYKQISENAELKNICEIMVCLLIISVSPANIRQGLQYGKKYDSIKSLRYGKLMIMTDQDQDGSHIKGLIINFIHHFWPDLLKV
jgi:DNA topoisomerase-2